MAVTNPPGAPVGWGAGPLPRGPESRPAGFSRSTSDTSTMVSFAARLCSFQMGPP